jgi:hypothetical protein
MGLPGHARFQNRASKQCPQRCALTCLKFCRRARFHLADFKLRSDGVCRLNPKIARDVLRPAALETQRKCVVRRALAIEHHKMSSAPQKITIHPDAASIHRVASDHGTSWAAVEDFERHSGRANQPFSIPHTRCGLWLWSKRRRSSVTWSIRGIC